MKITHKLIAQSLVMGLVPMLGIFALAWMASGDTFHQSASLYQNTSGATGDKIDRFLFERYGDVQAFAANHVLDDQKQWYKLDETSPIVRAINELVDIYDVYYLSAVVDLDGRVIAMSTRGPAASPVDTSALSQKNMRDTTWFRAATLGHFTTTSKFASKDNLVANGTLVDFSPESAELKAIYPELKGTTLTFTAPVKRGGKVIAYLTNWLEPAALEQIVQEAHKELGAGASMTLLDGEGHPFIALGIDPVNVPKIPGYAEVLRGESGHDYDQDPVDGRDILVGYAPLDGALGFPGLGWAMITRVDAHQAAPQIYASRRHELGLMALCMLAIGVVAVFFARTIAKPLVSMAQAAERIAAGDVNQEITHQGSDEVGMLAEAFRQMVGYIRGVSGAVSQLSVGDVEIKLEPRSDKDELTQSVLQMAGGVRLLLTRFQELIAASTAGALGSRLEPEQFSGAYRRLATDVNSMLDTLGAPVAEATRALERVAQRDLMATMQGDYRGDHARLKHALNIATGNVRAGLLQVARGAEQVKAASSQIASGSQGLAAGASEQASALTETHATLEGVAAMTQNNAASAQQASEAAGVAHQVSDRGAKSMAGLNDAVGRIRGAVVKTAEIIRDINQIAFQTNLLALNAAVEAARAGEAGRGFAVVADEVRNLAQQAKAAAQKTEDLLRDAVKQSEQGESISKEVSGGLEEIVSSVRKVEEIINQIATASQEQANGVAQVYSATTQMDQVTHQNAASSEELSSTAEQLSAQAQELTGMVRQFRLEEDAPAVTRVAEPKLNGKSNGNGHAPELASQMIPFNDDIELRDF